MYMCIIDCMLLIKPYFVLLVGLVAVPCKRWNLLITPYTKLAVAFANLSTTKIVRAEAFNDVYVCTKRWPAFLHGPRPQMLRLIVHSLTRTAAPRPPVQAVSEGGLMLITATDMAVLAGNNSEACWTKYGSYPLHRPYCHEQAVRILLACLEANAAR